MRKILTLIVIGIGFCTQTSLAVMPYLNDWLSVNPELSEKKQAIDLAVNVVLWAEDHQPFVVEDKQCHVAFATEAGQEDLERMLNYKTGLQHVRRALTPRFMAKSKYDRTYQSFKKGEFVLRRLGCCYTLCDKKKNNVHFFMGDEEQVNQCKIDYHDFLNWRSEIVTKNMESVYVRYLVDGSITPSFIPFIFSEFHRFKDAGLGDLFTAYMQRGNVDAEIVMDVMYQALDYEYGRSKLQVFIAYMGYDDTDPGVIAEIYKQAVRFNDPCAVEIYTAYMLREDTDPEMMINMLLRVENFENSSDKVSVVSAYIGNERADPDKVMDFVKEAQLKTHHDPWIHNSSEMHWKMPIHTAYLGRADADPKLVAEILKKAKEFGDEHCMMKIYTAYLKGVNLDGRVVGSLIIQGLLFSVPKNIIEFSQVCENKIIWITGLSPSF